MNIHDLIHLVETFGLDGSARKLSRWWRKANQSHPDQVPPSHQSDNQANAQHKHYLHLRQLARQESDQMKEKFDQAHQAYNAGRRREAKIFSTEGKAHQRKRDELNEQAAAWIFEANNRACPPDTIDLHGLFVQESITYTESFIARARRSRFKTVRVIVGKGVHSMQHQAKIRPAIEELVERQNIAVSLDEHNSGVLILVLEPARRGIDDRLRESLKRDGVPDCIVM